MNNGNKKNRWKVAAVQRRGDTENMRIEKHCLFIWLNTCMSFFCRFLHRQWNMEVYENISETFQIGPGDPCHPLFQYKIHTSYPCQHPTNLQSYLAQLLSHNTVRQKYHLHVDTHLAKTFVIIKNELGYWTCCIGNIVWLSDLINCQSNAGMSIFRPIFYWSDSIQ